VQTEQYVREVFPLRNHVYFDLGSTQVPARYVLLRKDQVPQFKESQVELFTPKNLTGRSDRQMIVYYNILNIVGERMVKYPSTTISLVGSSAQGNRDGLAMATTIQNYLVDIWDISPGRIAVEGRNKPAVAAVQGGTNELVLLKEGDRRVTIESASPQLLMEFTSGPGAPLRPVEIVTAPEAPIASYMTFDAKGSEALASWRLEIADEAGKVQYFGPYTEEKVSIPGNSILDGRPEGDYTITMIGETETGNLITRTDQAHIVLWTPPKSVEVMRFSVIYEFNESKAIALYDKYLTEVVVPKIPAGATVVIHGFTDGIGAVAYNLALSKSRAENVKAIIGKGLAKTARKDVKFEVYGYGEDPQKAQFDNSSPEERSYNRTVVIDIVPKQ
jgi:outer membrane protein OmpA-like peptidoglycan-associated protein